MSDSRARLDDRVKWKVGNLSRRGVVIQFAEVNYKSGGGHQINRRYLSEGCEHSDGDGSCVWWSDHGTSGMCRHLTTVMGDMVCKNSTVGNETIRIVLDAEK